MAAESVLWRRRSTRLDELHWAQFLTHLVENVVVLNPAVKEKQFSTKHWSAFRWLLFRALALSSSWLPLIIARWTILLLFHLFSFYLRSESGGGGGEQCLFLFRFMHQLACLLKGWKSSLLAAWAVFWKQYLCVFCNHCSININVLICLPKEVFHFLVIRKCCTGSLGWKQGESEYECVQSLACALE